MTAFKQDFFTYPGDTAQPIFTILDGAGVPINIASVAEIRWDARQKLSLPAAITKLMSTGGVVLIGGGVTGQLQINLSGSDTTPLLGVYLHQVVITDGFGTVSTVSLGQLTVGRAPSWTYDVTQLPTSLLMQVRREIGDTNKSDQQLWDDEINFALQLRPNSLYGAAAESCRFIAAKYSREVDFVQAELKTNYSNRAKAYLSMATLMESRARIAGPGTVYAGGISISDKQLQQQNTDRVSPAFAKGMTDNPRIPGSQAPETPNSPGQDTDREFPNF
jgi:hypothetical protein